jgi:ferredoxin
VKIRLDAARCTGHGRCYTLAPNVFDADDDGHCTLRTPEVAPGHEREARAAVLNCPEEALDLNE